MSKGWFKGAALVAIGVGALAMSVAQAQTDTTAPAAEDATQAAKPAHKPKAAHKPKVSKLPSITVVVNNARFVGLVELTAVLSGSGGDAVKIAGPLAAGKKTIAHLAHDKACLFDLHGSFADGAETDTSGVELCKDKKIDLTD